MSVNKSAVSLDVGGSDGKILYVGYVFDWWYLDLLKYVGWHGCKLSWYSFKQQRPTSQKIAMKEIRLSIPELALVVGTRAALGAGVSLLLGDKLLKEQKKKAVGWTLFLIGAITTIPLLFIVFGRRGKEQNLIDFEDNIWKG